MICHCSHIFATDHQKILAPPTSLKDFDDQNLQSPNETSVGQHHLHRSFGRSSKLDVQRIPPMAGRLYPSLRCRRQKRMQEKAQRLIMPDFHGSNPRYVGEIARIESPVSR